MKIKSQGLHVTEVICSSNLSILAALVMDPNEPPADFPEEMGRRILEQFPDAEPA